MSEYSSNYEWWIKEHPEMLTWVLDNEGNISIGDVIEALHNHPQCPLALKAVGVNTRIGKGRQKMEDRELIADIIYSFCWLASDDRDDALDLADRIIEAGYIRQPEPSVDNELACGKENNRRNPNTN